MAFNKLHAVLSAGYVLVQAGIPLAAQATENLDLSSQDRTVSAGSNFQQAQITRSDGSSSPIVAGQLLTPAEFVALSQVLQPGGQQTIVVAATGNAVGGSVNLAQFSNNLATLHIPQGVIAVSDAAAGPLSISGNLTNSGSLYALSTNSAITSAVISASNIFNSQGALLTSILPSGGLTGFGNAISGLNLSLNAVNDIINAGTISSAGSLNMSAGGSIISALPQGVTGTQPIMQALANVNLISSQLANAGLIASLAGNISISSQVAQDIIIRNQGGTLSALNGFINVRDEAFTAGKSNLDILGGDVLARELNLFSGNGKINISVNDLSGRINVCSHELAIQANTPAIVMGNVVVTGDPIITNQSGDVLIEPDFDDTFTTSGGPLIVTASGNIIASAAKIDTSGGQIQMTAGQNIDLSSTLLLNSTNGSGVGGPIQLTALGGNILLNQAGTVNSGGSIEMSAAGFIDAGNLTTHGSAVVLHAGSTIATGNITTTGTGVGGGVDINSQLAGGAAPFVIGLSTSGRNANAVNGSIVTTGGTISGFLHVNNGGSGNIVVDPGSVNVTGAANGGAIALNAGIGDIIFGPGTLSTAGGESYSSGLVFLAGNNIVLDDTIIDVSGFVPGSVLTSSSELTLSGASGISATGYFSGGTIQLMPSDSLSISTTFNPNTGEHHLIADGITNYSNSLAINTSGTANLNAGGELGGGFINVAGGDVSFSGGTVLMNASATQDGFGGTVLIDTVSLTNSSAITATANGAGSGGGGSVSISTSDIGSELFVGNGSGAISLVADGGEFGDGGSVNLSIAGGLNIDLSAISAAHGTSGLAGGHVNVASGYGGSGDLNVSGSLSVDGIYGGSIYLQHDNATGSMTVDSSAVMSANGGTDGIAGTIDLVAAHSLTVDGSLSVNGTDGGSAGLITVQAGTVSPGSMSLTGSMTADADSTGDAGQVSIIANTSASASISGTVSASATGSGTAGKILVNRSDAGNLSIGLTGSLTASASSGNGKIELNHNAGLQVSGSGEIIGNLSANAKSVDISLSRNGSTLTLNDVSSSAGNVTIRGTGANSTVRVVENGTVAANGGTLTLGAANIRLDNNSHLSMDAPGLMTLDSGVPTNSLNLYLPDSGTAFIAMPAGGPGQRPGAVLVTPRDGGSVTIASSGSAQASLEVTGATLSGSTTSGNLTIAANASVSSDSFDELLNFGIELTSVSGNVNLLGSASTSHLSMSTTGGGNVFLGSEINSPTVVISTTGNGTITQAQGMSIGIGSLTLSSDQGNIGSQAQALNTNVLELKVTSNANVFLTNDSSVDIKTSTVNGTFSLTNNGDVSFESAVDSNSLVVNATGSVSVLNAVQGDTGVNLTATGASNAISVSGSLISSAGNISLSTDSLSFSGLIETQAAGGHIDVFGGNSLTVASNSGQMRATGNGVVTFSAANSISLPSSIKVEVGSSGSLGIVTTGAAGAVSLGSGATSTLHVAGGGLLSMVASSLTITNGSTIRVDRTSGTAMAIAPAGSNTPLSIHLASSGGGHLVTSGGAIQIASGLNAPLVFDNNGQLLAADLTISGGAFNTTSTNANTSLNNVNIISDNNITINVHNGTLDMGGELNSTKVNGVIALVDPNGLTVAGNGNISFINGGYGQILIAASGAGNNLTFTGSHNLNTGVGGKVDLTSDASIILGSGAHLNVNGGAAKLVAPSIIFQQNSVLNTSSTLSMSGNGLQVTAPGGGQASINAGGAITISSTAGTQLSFATSAPGQNALLAFTGVPLNIQSSNADVVVGANVTLQNDHDINISTPGGTLVNNGKIEAPNQNNTITIESSGNLLVVQNVSAQNIIVRTLANNGNITLASDLEAFHRLEITAHGSGYIRQRSGSLKADELVLRSGSGNIGTDDRSIKFTANSVQVSTTGSAWVEAKTNVQVASANVGHRFNLTGQGSITIGPGGVSGGERVRIEAAKNIVVNGGIAGSEKVKLITNKGSISGNGEISSHKVVLFTTKGDIGSQLNPLNIRADVLKVRTEQSGSAYLHEANTITVNRVNVAGAFSLNAGGALTVHKVSTNNGNLTLVSAGSIHLADESALYCNEGNILIQSTDKANGTIRIGDKSTIESYASASGKGNVTVVVGDVPSSPVKGTAPKGVSVSKKWGGEVYFGKNGITSEGKKNQINAWGSNVIFSTGNRPASAIVLEGNIEITADPPLAPSIDMVAVPAAASQTAVTLPSLPLVLPSAVTPVLFPNTPVQMSTPFGAGVETTDEKAVRRSGANAKEDSIYTAVAFATAPAISAYHSAPSPARTTLADDADIRQAKGTDVSDLNNGQLTLTHGEILVQAKKPITITAGSDRITMARGTVALVRKNSESLEVFNLYEPHSGAVEVVLRERHSVKVGVGTSFSTGQATLSHSVASRHRKEHTIESNKTQSAEYSLLSLASRAEIVSAMLGSSDKREQRLVEKLLKMAAALSVVTGAHGPYSNK